MAAARPRRFETADWAAQARAEALLDLRLYAVTDPRQNERLGRSNAEQVMSPQPSIASLVITVRFCSR